MYKAQHISPMIPSYNVKETVAFFTEVLSFSIFMDGEYAILFKDNLSVHILNAGNEIGEMEFYLSVDNVDSLWAEIQDRLSGIKVREPFDREYGMREIHIIVPQTKTLLLVGSAMPPDPLKGEL